jgi:Rod binding domain-containing protein
MDVTMPSTAGYPILPDGAEGALRPSAGTSDDDARRAAAQFEGILLRRMLREVRESSIVPSESAVGRGFGDLFDDHLAQSISRAGGLGLARTLADRLVEQVRDARALTGSAGASVYPET